MSLKSRIRWTWQPGGGAGFKRGQQPPSPKRPPRFTGRFLSLLSSPRVWQSCPQEPGSRLCPLLPHCQGQPLRHAAMPRPCRAISTDDERGAQSSLLHTGNPRTFLPCPLLGQRCSEGLTLPPGPLPPPCPSPCFLQTSAPSQPYPKPGLATMLATSVSTRRVTGW